MRIHLDIDTLILRNLPYEQRYPISAAVEEELLRLFTDYGTPPLLAQGGYVPHISIPALSITTESKPEVIGSLIAQQLYQSFHQPAASSQHSDPQRGHGNLMPSARTYRERAATNSRVVATDTRREMPSLQAE